MRRVTAIIVMAMLIICALPRPAYAIGWWRWLAELSGPGPLEGPEETFTLYCFKKPSAERIQRQGLGCDSIPVNQIRAFLRANGAFMWGAYNLTPADGSVRGDIRAFSAIGSVDFNVARGIELGGGAGIIRFSDLPADSFSKPILVAHAIVRPLQMVWGRDTRTARSIRLSAIEFKYEAVFLPSGFTAEEFGAVPGSFQAGAEGKNTISINVDLLRLVR